MKSLIITSLIVVLSSGCATKLYTPDFNKLYGQSATHHDLDRNPVIVIPGILGSKLKDGPTGKDVWGAFSGAYANPKDDEGMRLFALPMEFGARLHDLKDGVLPAGALDKVMLNLFFIPVRLNAYFHILRSLGVGGYRDQQLADAGVIDYGSDHFTCFQFDYDWRRDISENAQLLHEFISEKEEYIRAEFKQRFGLDNQDIKFDIVAHSMGGLLLRYYLRYGNQELPEDGSLPELNWAGADNVERGILIGTPNAGSVIALIQLVEGIKVGPFIPYYDPAVIGTMPAVYQLLPRTRHKAVLDQKESEVNIFDVKVWEEMNWGLADTEQAEILERLLPDIESASTRRQVALEHLEKNLKRAEQFHRALDKRAESPEGLKMILFAGDAKDTEAVVGVNTHTGELEVIEKSPGDLTVTRSSAIMDERIGGEWKPKLVSPISWHNVTFLFTDHLGLTKDPVFTDNILYYLLEEPAA